MMRPMRRSLCVLVWLLLSWCSDAFALNPALEISQYIHTAWRIRDGFATGTIKAITQTSDGYRWLGSYTGLLRFDGVRAVPWQWPTDQRLPSERALRLLASSDGTLWIGTDAGLASWKDRNLTHYHDLDGRVIAKLVEDREHSVWVLTYRLTANTW